MYITIATRCDIREAHWTIMVLPHFLLIFLFYFYFEIYRDGSMCSTGDLEALQKSHEAIKCFCEKKPPSLFLTITFQD